MKRFNLAVLLLVPLVLAACSTDNTNSSNDSSSKTEKIAKSSSSAKSKGSSTTNNGTSNQNSSKTNPTSSSSTNMTREELTAAEKKNNHQPLKNEPIQNEKQAIALLTQKYGDQNWKVAFNSIGKTSPIYFHITSKDKGSYYVYTNGDIQSADGDLSGHNLNQ